jgi:hypothetical protein
MSAYAWEFATAMNEIPQWNHRVGMLPGAVLQVELNGAHGIASAWTGAAGSVTSSSGCGAE